MAKSGATAAAPKRNATRTRGDDAGATEAAVRDETDVTVGPMLTLFGDTLPGVTVGILRAPFRSPLGVPSGKPPGRRFGSVVGHSPASNRRISFSTRW